ncbi:hypothetical protein JG687_00011611 [Phytophthora cactorum]|uniref:Uncharacterized protein n=1 Tax=Phytophthora cactorum TaxID=29920 RepID=A0A8T1U8Q6_9STRA|nr:hypothetical protein JG687_00011611 [Phytophthora cactorum]
MSVKRPEKKSETDGTVILKDEEEGSKESRTFRRMRRYTLMHTVYQKVMQSRLQRVPYVTLGCRIRVIYYITLQCWHTARGIY